MVLMFLSSHTLTLLFVLNKTHKKNHPKTKQKITHTQKKPPKTKEKKKSSLELFVRKMNELGHKTRGGGGEGWLYLDISDLQGLSSTEQHPALNISGLWQQELP